MRRSVRDSTSTVSSRREGRQDVEVEGNVVDLESTTAPLHSSKPARFPQLARSRFDDIATIRDPSVDVARFAVVVEMPSGRSTTLPSTSTSWRLLVRTRRWM